MYNLEQMEYTCKFCILSFLLINTCCRTTLKKCVLRNFALKDSAPHVGKSNLVLI